MRLYWTEPATDDLLGIHEYILRQSPNYADSVYERIRDRPQQLIDFPHSGSVVPEFARGDVRELFVYSYRLIYQVLPNEIRILAVIHGSQLLGRLPIDEE